MGQLVNGKWEQFDVRQGAKNSDGEFIRKPMSFRGSINEGTEYPPESGRYHLYIAYACPWAHRALIMRALKGLNDHISMSAVSPYMLQDGWTFLKDYDDIPNDPLHNLQFLRELYTKVDSQFTGRVTVPVLYDKENNKIVNNESSEIIRIFNSEFQNLSDNDIDYYPEPLRQKIDEWNEVIYNNVNNGVYRCGFSRSQSAYEKAYRGLFETLDKVDKQLKETKYLCGDQITEADVRLFPTLIRFDTVYHTHFKCNGKLIAQYEGLSRFTKEFLNLPGVRETLNMDHVKSHYYYSHKEINPSQIVPLGPLENPLD